MVKRLFSAFLTVCIVFGISSCSKENSNLGIDVDKEENDIKDQEDELPHSHAYGEATCTDAARCECGVTQGKALGHSFEEATCTTPKICTRCQVIASAALEHDYRAATCTAPQICKRCENIVGEPLGHNYAEATCLLPKTCLVCGSTKDVPMGHSYVDNICIRCEEIDPASLPVPLESLVVISSTKYEVKSVTSSYGDQYATAHHYGSGAFTSYSVHNLNMEYSLFSGSIVVAGGMDEVADVSIYVDDELVYFLEDIYVETAKKDFSIDVTGASKLKIQVYRSSWDGTAGVAIVNAQLER